MVEKENLLTPEWHTKDDFGHGSGLSSILHQNVVISPNTVVLDVCSTRSQSSPPSQRLDRRPGLERRRLRPWASPGNSHFVGYLSGSLPKREKICSWPSPHRSSRSKWDSVQRLSVEGLCRIPTSDLFLLKPGHQWISTSFHRASIHHHPRLLDGISGLRWAPVLIPPNFAPNPICVLHPAEPSTMKTCPCWFARSLEPGNIRKTARELKTR